jgi:FHS family Na+ dependent glucose MFS transporter 1
MNEDPHYSVITDRNDKRTRQAIGYFAAFVALGLTTASIGPTLPGLAQNTHTNLRQVSFLFMARAIGYLIGSFLIGGLYDRVPGNPVLAGTLIAIAAMMGLVPTVNLIWVLLPIMLVIGMGEGGLDVGGNTLLLRSKPANVGPYINGLHFFYGVGALISPIIIGQVVLFTGAINGAYYALALLLAPAAGWLLSLPSPPVKLASRNPDGSARRNLPVVLIALFFLLYVGSEVGFGGWIFTYAVALDLADKTTAAYLTSAFWCALTLGRLVAIPVAGRFRPRLVMICDLAGVVAFATVMLIWPGWPVAAWLGTIGIGLSMAPIYPVMLSMAERRMAITGRVTAWFVVGASLGCIILPWLVGQLFESIGPRVMVVAVTFSMVLAAGAFALLVLVTTPRSGDQRPAKEQSTPAVESAASDFGTD